MNTHVGRIARCQAEMGGYTMPSIPMAFTDESDGSENADDTDDDDATTSEDEDDDADDATASEDDANDGDASFSGTNEMST